MAVLFAADSKATLAASQKDDYETLTRNLSGFHDSLFFGAKQLAQIAWEAGVRQCKALFE
jgi:hypothetical protein